MIAALALSLLVSTNTTQYAPQRMGTEPLSPEQEARVQRLGKQLRCAVCQGLSITDSPSSMARAQLDKVRELVQAGKSDPEVLAYFTGLYGDWVLLEPKREGLNLFLWFGPAVLLLGGLAFLLARVRRRTNVPAGQTTPASPPTAAPPEDEYLARLRSELDR